MKFTIASGLAATSLLAVASAAGTLHLETYREVDFETSRDVALRGRSTTNTLVVPMDNLVVQYRINVTIGTPAQSLIIAVDTGSSDVWVPGAQACGANSESTCDGGYFSNALSSTFQDLGSGFQISYVDKSSSTGNYFSDNLSVNGVTLKDFEMGLASETTVPIGLLGIGYPSNEANVATGKIQAHPTFVTALVSAGDIASTAYSLYLDDLHESTGSLLFGGIDTKKYNGTLALINIYNPTGTNINEFLVALTSVSASSSSGTDQLTPSGYAVGVVLDSGTTLTYLPTDLATLLFNEVGATYNSTLEIAFVPCSLGSKSGTINFSFGGHGGPQVVVPMSELVEPISLTNGKNLTDSNGKPICRFGISSQASDATNSLLFGDTFLRSAYVVYDLENNQIGIAQAKYNSGESNVVPFPSKGATIPSATVAPMVTVATATAVATGQSLTAAKGFQSAAGRGLVPLGLVELAMLALGVTLFSFAGISGRI